MAIGHINSSFLVNLIRFLLTLILILNTSQILVCIPNLHPNKCSSGTQNPSLHPSSFASQSLCCAWLLDGSSSEINDPVKWRSNVTAWAEVAACNTSLMPKSERERDTDRGGRWGGVGRDSVASGQNLGMPAE